LSRRLSQSFRCAALGDLTRQLLFAPPDKRIKQVRRAELLHDEIDPASGYPLDFLSYRITAYRSESQDTTLLFGQAILPDLRLMIDVLSRSVGMPITDDEPVESTQDLAQRLNVSTKTISRWRKLGLRWRWIAQPNNPRPQIGFTRLAVDRFQAQQKHRVQRASRFTHLDPLLRQTLIKRAKRLARARPVSMNQVAKHLAKRVGRALETIRLILEHHDAQHPQDKIFVQHSAPLDAHQRRLIARAYQMGVPVGRLAQRFNRSIPTIYRAVHQQRATTLCRLPINYTTSPIFLRDDADQVLLRPQPNPKHEPVASIAKPSQLALLQDLPLPLQPLYRGPSLDQQTQQSLLIRYNYLKFKADHQRSQINPSQPRVADLDQIETWLKQAADIRQRLAASSMVGVLSVARKHLVQHPDRSAAQLVELLEIGHTVAFQAIEGFDPWQGRDFDTYLTWQLMRRFVQEQSTDNMTTKAHRKLDPVAILKKMQDTANACGIRLGY